MFSFTNTQGLPIDHPGEWSSAHIVLDVSSNDWQKVELKLQGVILPVKLQLLNKRPAVTATWPRSGPGTYLLEVSFNDIVHSQTVAIKPGKISEESYKTMLQELEEKLPASIAIALNARSGHAGVKFFDGRLCTISQEIVRLRRAILGRADESDENEVLGLVGALKAISQNPHRILKSNEKLVAAHKVRRPLPAKLGHAIARGYDPKDFSQRNAIVDSDVGHSFDVFENRLLKAYIAQVQFRLKTLQNALNIQRYKEQRDELIGLAFALEKSLKEAKFLNQVVELDSVPATVTMVLKQRPAYKAVLTGYLNFKKAMGVVFEDDGLDVPLENCPMLYQKWCTLTVLDCLIKEALDRGYRLKEQCLYKQERGDLFVRLMPNGLPLVTLEHPVRKTTVSLIPEKTYRESGDLQSTSFWQRPDISIEVSDDGMPQRVYILDPKYKLDSDVIEDESFVVPETHREQSLGTPKKCDIEKMHVYRDAVRDKDGAAVVKFAGIMYPGPSVKYQSGLEALNAYPSASNELRSRLEGLCDEML